MISLLTGRDNQSKLLQKKFHSPLRAGNSNLWMQVRNKICTLLLCRIWLLNCIFSTNKILSMGHKMRSMLMLLFCTITQLIKKSKDNFIITTLYQVSLEIKAKSKSLWPVTLSIVVFQLWSKQIYHKLIVRFNLMHTGNSLRHLRT